MTRILFWNLGRRELTEALVCLCHEQAVDILILAEYAGHGAGLLTALNSAGGVRFYRWADTLSGRIAMLHARPVDSASLRAASGYYAIFAVQPESGPEIILAAVHLPSKLHAAGSDQMGFAEDVRREVDRLEREAGHSRSLVIGDFNMNPFDPGMVSARGFHAVMDRRIAARRVRHIGGVEYGYFYNPLWNLLGDRQGPGSYYRRPSYFEAYHWHCYDQVLLRPALAGRVAPEGVRLVRAIAGQSLLNRHGVINRHEFSDHLPLIVELEDQEVGNEP